MLQSSSTALASFAILALGGVVADRAEARSITGSPVWVVDDDGGIGTDFIDLQAAVDAAADGDTILIRPGLYGSFSIAGKGVDLVADIDGSVICLGDGRIRNVPQGSSVSVRGVRIVADGAPGLRARNCDGPLWLEACTLRGGAGDGFVGSPSFHPAGRSGLEVIDCQQVALLRCTLEGGAGSTLFGAAVVPGAGGHGIRAVKSDLAVYDCTCAGGAGGSGATDASAADGGDGGSGLFFDVSEVMASGTGFVGGDGGGAGALLLPGPAVCGAAGDGGDGVEQVWPATNAVVVRFLDCTIAPGVGGAAYLPTTCPGGDDGLPARISFGAIDGLAGPSFGHRASSPVRQGNPVEFVLTGEPGAIAVIGISLAPTLYFDPSVNGTVLLDPTLTVVTAVGPLAPGGSLTHSWLGAPGVGPGHALSIHAQPVFFVPSSGAFTVGPGSVLTVLDPSL